MRVMLLFAVCCVNFAFASHAHAQSGQPLFLEHADSSEVLRAEGQTEYHLFGNVRFVQGETRLASDRAIWKKDSGSVWFDGRVMIQQPKRYLRARRVYYNLNTRAFFAYDSVHVEDTAQAFALHAERVQFERNQNLARADSLPVMFWDFLLDSASQTIIFADTLLFDRAGRHGIAIGSVRVLKGDWDAKGDYGEIWPDSGKALLAGKPKASGIGGVIAGDTLYMFYSGKHVDRVRAIGQATGSYQDTTLGGAGQNLIRGETADFFLTNDTLKAIRVVGQAYTDYRPDDPNTGYNNASGDSLWLDFQSGRLDQVIIQGGSQGVYRAPNANGTEDTVRYQGSTIVFVPDSNRIDLVEQAQLNYHQIELQAGRISYWTEARDLVARPIIPEPDTLPLQERPRLADDQQVVVGDTLTYNIDSRRGRIWGSSTEFEGGYYRGEDFRKFTDEVFFVEHGSYTTCDLEEPHFHFESKNMVVIRDDKIIARPVVMKIGELPMLYLPYYVFPIRRGRHSGFLPIRFGNFDRGNRFISNAGYYWAASEYWDLEGALDFNEETGINLRSTVNYALRYKFSGNVSGSYARESRFSSTGRSKRTVWSLRGSHQQTLSETASLSGSMNFLSDKSYYEDYVYNPDDRRQRTLTSQLNLSKRFKTASLSVGLRSTENLDTKDRTRQLPQASLNFFNRRIISPDSGQDARWYHNAYVSLGSDLNHFEHRYIVAKTRQEGDSTVVDSVETKAHYATMNHRGTISFPQRLFKYITFSPSGSFQETWYYVFDTPFAREKGIPVNDPGRRISGSVGVGANTNLYGFLNPHLFGVSAIRHTLTPSVAYSFTPAIKQNDELRSFTGAGGGSSRRSQAISVGLNNVFDAKLGEGDSERRVSLFNASISSSYNFEADEHRWANPGAGLRTNLASRLSLSANASWEIYNEQTGDLQWTNPRLLTFGVSAATSLKGKGSAFTSVTGLADERQDSLFAKDELPFDIALSYRYDESRTGFGTSKTHWISTRVDLEPTENWKVSMTSRYDMVRHRITDQTFEFTRELHCWRANFVWRPGGSGQGYYFQIGIIDIPDIKISRSESGLRGAIWR